MEIGWMTWLMDGGCIRDSMELSMKEGGRMTILMEKGVRCGWMGVDTRGSLDLDRGMVMESINGQMRVGMKDSGLIIRLKDRALTHGQMEGSTKESG